MREITNIKTQWDLTPLYSGDIEVQLKKADQDLLDASYKFINKWKDRTDYLEDSKVLLQALNEHENWSRYFGVEGLQSYYIALRESLDQNSTSLKAKSSKLTELAIKISNDIQFFTLRLSKIPVDKQTMFLEYPGLVQYKHFLERLFATAKYSLSEAEEKILTLKSTTSYANWVRMTSAFLSREESKILGEDGQEKVASFAEIWSTIDNKNKKIRKRAAKVFNKILRKHAPLAEEEMNAVLLNKKVDDGLRGLSRPDLDMLISDDIQPEIVDTMLKAVSNRFSQAHRFYKLKAALLGGKHLKYYEINVPYGTGTKRFSFEASVALVNKVFNSLDPEFSEIFADFVEHGRIDAFPKKNKATGAFCVGDYKDAPIYILLTHSNALSDVPVLAHEMGHGLNFYYTNKTQNALNCYSPLSTAEVSSTFFEDFVFEELLKGAGKEERLSLLISKLQEQIATIHRQVACYLFEMELHTSYREKGFLSKEQIGEIFVKNMKNYLGPNVDFPMGTENWWVHWDHIRSYFYVYSYANGLLISKAMQNFVKKDPAFISKVKDFLSAGMAKSPRDTFADMGIDIMDKSFWDKGLDEIDALISEAESLAKELGKIL